MRARADADAILHGSDERCSGWGTDSRGGECEGYVPGTYESPSTTCTGGCFFAPARLPSDSLSATCESCRDTFPVGVRPASWVCYDEEDAVSTTKCSSDDIAKMRDEDDSTWLSADCWLCLAMVVKDPDSDYDGIENCIFNDGRLGMNEMDPETGERAHDKRPGDCITEDIVAACGVTDLNKVSAAAHAVVTATSLVAAVTTLTFGS